MSGQPARAVDLEQTLDAHAQQRLQAAVGRAQNAMIFIRHLIDREERTPELPRMRTLINLSFDASDYFITKANEPLRDSE